MLFSRILAQKKLFYSLSFVEIFKFSDFLSLWLMYVVIALVTLTFLLSRYVFLIYHLVFRCHNRGNEPRAQDPALDRDLLIDCRHVSWEFYSSRYLAGDITVPVLYIRICTVKDDSQPQLFSIIR
jgi:hypothetical protein